MEHMYKRIIDIILDDTLRYLHILCGHIGRIMHVLSDNNKQNEKLRLNRVQDLLNVKFC
jgi:hypothetical protein